MPTAMLNLMPAAGPMPSGNTGVAAGNATAAGDHGSGDSFASCLAAAESSPAPAADQAAEASTPSADASRAESPGKTTVRDGNGDGTAKPARPNPSLLAGLPGTLAQLALAAANDEPDGMVTGSDPGTPQHGTQGGASCTSFTGLAARGQLLRQMRQALSDATTALATWPSATTQGIAASPDTAALGPIGEWSDLTQADPALPLDGGVVALAATPWTPTSAFMAASAPGLSNSAPEMLDNSSGAGHAAAAAVKPGPSPAWPLSSGAGANVDDAAPGATLPGAADNATLAGSAAAASAGQAARALAGTSRHDPGSAPSAVGGSTPDGVAAAPAADPNVLPSGTEPPVGRAGATDAAETAQDRAAAAHRSTLAAGANGVPAAQARHATLHEGSPASSDPRAAAAAELRVSEAGGPGTNGNGSNASITAGTSQTPAAPSHAPTHAAAMSGSTPSFAESLRAAFEAPLSARVGSPHFAPALGVQVATLVKNGVPEARLHLHPAELGPIAVQIALDGSAARVNMAADHALTRQALEQAMPQLASALRDAGFTLAGGGVSQQSAEQAQQQHAQAGQGSPDRRDGGQTQAGAAAGETEALAGPRAAARVRTAAGGVDLYA